MTLMRVTMLMMVLTLTVPAPAADAGQAAEFKEQAAEMAAAVDEIVSTAVRSGRLLQDSKVTYLEGYGVVVIAETALEPPRNPFTSARTPAEIRRSSDAHRAELKHRLVEFVAQQAGAMDSIPVDQRVTIVIHMLNPNPVDLGDLPTQLIVSVVRQDALDLQSGVISEPAFAVAIREY